MPSSAYRISFVHSFNSVYYNFLSCWWAAFCQELRGQAPNFGSVAALTLTCSWDCGKRQWIEKIMVWYGEWEKWRWERRTQKWRGMKGMLYFYLPRWNAACFVICDLVTRLASFWGLWFRFGHTLYLMKTACSHVCYRRWCVVLFSQIYVCYMMLLFFV